MLLLLLECQLLPYLVLPLPSQGLVLTCLCVPLSLHAAQFCRRHLRHLVILPMRVVYSSGFPLVRWKDISNRRLAHQDLKDTIPLAFCAASLFFAALRMVSYMRLCLLRFFGSPCAPPGVPAAAAAAATLLLIDRFVPRVVICVVGVCGGGRCSSSGAVPKRDRQRS